MQFVCSSPDLDSALLNKMITKSGAKLFIPWSKNLKRQNEFMITSFVLFGPIDNGLRKHFVFIDFVSKFINE